MHTAHTLGRAFRAVHASWHRIQSLRNPAAAPHGSPIKHCGGTERMKSGFFDGFTAKLAPMAAGRGPVHPPASGGAQERQPPDVSAPDAPPSPRGYGGQAGGAGEGTENAVAHGFSACFPSGRTGGSSLFHPLEAGCFPQICTISWETGQKRPQEYASGFPGYTCCYYTLPICKNQEAFPNFTPPVPCIKRPDSRLISRCFPCFFHPFRNFSQNCNIAPNFFQLCNKVVRIEVPVCRRTDKRVSPPRASVIPPCPCSGTGRTVRASAGVGYPRRMKASSSSGVSARKSGPAASRDALGR